MRGHEGLAFPCAPPRPMRTAWIIPRRRIGFDFSGCGQLDSAVLRRSGRAACHRGGITRE